MKAATTKPGSAISEGCRHTNRTGSDRGSGGQQRPRCPAVRKSADVQAQIEAAFKRSAEIDARRISVTAQDGKVIMTGNARSWRSAGRSHVPFGPRRVSRRLKTGWESCLSSRENYTRRIRHQADGMLRARRTCKDPETMKRREAKFVHGSPRLSPEQIKAAAHLHETQARPIGRRPTPQVPRTRSAGDSPRKP